jgi:hypothetical protein
MSWRLDSAGRFRHVDVEQISAGSAGADKNADLQQERMIRQWILIITRRKLSPRQLWRPINETFAPNTPLTGCSSIFNAKREDHPLVVRRIFIPAFIDEHFSTV